MIRKRIKNNKGVTVLEVVIAVAILVALSIPVGKAIIASSRYQYKARIRENLNIVAESLMENFKAFSIDEMTERLSNDTYSEVLYGCKITDSTEFKYEEKEDETIEFTVTDLEIYNDTYEITAKVTPTSAYSDIELTSFDDFDKVTSAMALIPDTEDNAYEEARRDFEEQHAVDFLTKYQAHEKMNDTTLLSIANIDYSHLVLLSRQINIFIGSTCYYNITYEYMIKDYPYNEKRTVVKNGIPQDEFYRRTFDYETCTFTTGNESFYTGTSSGELKLNRCYVYYYPIYSLGKSMDFADSVSVNNNVSGEMSVYILKQPNLSIGASLDSYEESYTPAVSLNGNAMNFYHNLNRNLYKNTTMNRFGGGKDISEALIKKNNTILYDVDIEVKKDDTVWTKLSSTIKK